MYGRWKKNSHTRWETFSESHKPKGHWSKQCFAHIILRAHNERKRTFGRLGQCLLEKLCLERELRTCCPTLEFYPPFSVQRRMPLAATLCEHSNVLTVASEKLGCHVTKRYGNVTWLSVTKASGCTRQTVATLGRRWHGLRDCELAGSSQSKRKRRSRHNFSRKSWRCNANKRSFCFT